MNAHPNPSAFAMSSAASISIQDRVILALDVPTVEEAEAVVKEVGSAVSFFKIGLQLQYAGGIKYSKDLVQQGKKVFLDSKIFDIGNTIEKTVENISLMGVQFLTVHGDRKVIQSAASAARNDLKILAVTVLTSLDETDLSDMGITMHMEEFVRMRARIAIEAGADGVIASGREAGMIRNLAKETNKSALKIVTPGIRPVGSAWNDQRRVTTPVEAIEGGADYLVVGRPVLNAASKGVVLDKIFADVEAGLASRSKST